jgi:hypothetical protein
MLRLAGDTRLRAYGPFENHGEAYEFAREKELNACSDIASGRTFDPSEYRVVSLDEVD